MLKLHGLAGTLLDDFIQIALKSAEAQLFGGGAGAGGSSGGLGGVLGSLLRGIGIGGPSLAAGPSLGLSSADASFALPSYDFSGSIPAFASGGTFKIGGRGGIDQNLMSINGQPVARVNQGEHVNIVPANQRVNAPSPAITVLAPRHYDLSNSLIDRDTLAQMNEENREYSRQVAAVSGQQAVSAANSQAPSVIKRAQTLKG
jgi:hypothetical protein